MRCNKSKTLISRSMDERLPELEGLELSGHLESCESCTGYQTDLYRIRELMLATESAPSASFEWNVQLGIQRALREAAARDDAVRTSKPFWMPVGATALVAAAFVLFVGGALLGDRVSPSMQTPGFDGAGPVASAPAAGRQLINFDPGSSSLVSGTSRPMFASDGNATIPVSLGSPGRTNWRRSPTAEIFQAGGRQRFLSPPRGLSVRQFGPAASSADPSDSLATASPER